MDPNCAIFLDPSVMSHTGVGRMGVTRRAPKNDPVRNVQKEESFPLEVYYLFQFNAMDF